MPEAPPCGVVTPNRSCWGAAAGKTPPCLKSEAGSWLLWLLRSWGPCISRSTSSVFSVTPCREMPLALRTAQRSRTRSARRASRSGGRADRARHRRHWFTRSSALPRHAEQNDSWHWAHVRRLFNKLNFAAQLSQFPVFPMLPPNSPPSLGKFMKSRNSFINAGAPICHLGVSRIRQNDNDSVIPPVLPSTERRFCSSRKDKTGNEVHESTAARQANCTVSLHHETAKRFPEKRKHRVTRRHMTNAKSSQSSPFSKGTNTTNNTFQNLQHHEHWQH